MLRKVPASLGVGGDSVYLAGTLAFILDPFTTRSPVPASWGVLSVLAMGCQGLMGPLGVWSRERVVKCRVEQQDPPSGRDGVWQC